MAALGATGYQATTVSSGAAARTRSNSAFIRELWTDEVLASYKVNVVLPQLVTTMDFVGQKGDTVHIPTPARIDFATGVIQRTLTATAEITLPTAANTSITDVLIDQHWFYPAMIQDIVKIQAEDNFRRFITDDAGYQLSRKVDSVLWTRTSGFAGAHATPTTAGTEAWVAGTKAVVGALSAGSVVVWDPAANANAGNASHLTEEALRRYLRELDDNDVPSRNRALLIPPVEKEYLLGISRFTEQAFVGEAGAQNSIRTGRVGNVFGVEVYVSSSSPTVADDGAATDQRAAALFQKDSIVLVEQMRPRMQSQYLLEFLGELMVVDLVFGTKLIRPEGGISIVVPSN